MSSKGGGELLSCVCAGVDLESGVEWSGVGLLVGECVRFGSCTPSRSNCQLDGRSSLGDRHRVAGTIGVTPLNRLARPPVYHQLMKWGGQHAQNIYAKLRMFGWGQEKKLLHLIPCCPNLGLPNPWPDPLAGSILA
jgi:hypothetical protein